MPFHRQLLICILLALGLASSHAGKIQDARNFLLHLADRNHPIGPGPFDDSDLPKICETIFFGTAVLLQRPQPTQIRLGVEALETLEQTDLKSIADDCVNLILRDDLRTELRRSIDMHAHDLLGAKNARVLLDLTAVSWTNDIKPRFNPGARNPLFPLPH